MRFLFNLFLTLVAVGLLLFFTGNLGPRPATPPGTPPPAAGAPAPAPTAAPGNGGGSGNGLVAVTAQGRVYMPGGDPGKPYTANFTIRQGGQYCYNGVSAALLRGNQQLAGGRNGVTVTLEPGEYAFAGDPAHNNGAELKPGSC